MASDQLPQRETDWTDVALAALGVYVALGGLISLTGWIADLPRLTDWENNGISIQPNAALAATTTGLALLAFAGGYRRVALALGVFVTLIGATTLFQWVSGISLGTDTLLMFGHTWGRRGVLVPGRMGPPGATSWTFIGCALVLASASAPNLVRLRRVVPALGGAAGVISSLSLIGYLYGADILYTLPTVTVIAFQTATFVLAASAGVMLAVPDLGIVRLLCETGPVGVLVRRILPAIVVVPIVLGSVRLVGQRAGLYDVEFGTAARTLAEIGLLLALLWWTARTVSRQVAARQHAEDAVAASQRRLTDTLENLTDGFVTLDRNWRYTYVNPAAERLLGRTRDELLGRVRWEIFPDTPGSLADQELHRAFSARVSVAFEHFDEKLNRWFYHKAYPTPDGGIAAYFQDVTARRALDDELRQSRVQLETDLADSVLLQRLSAALIHEDDVEGLYEKLVDSAIQLTKAHCASMHLLHANPDGRTAGDLRLLASRGFTTDAAVFWNAVGTGPHSTSVGASTTAERMVLADVLSCDGLASTPELKGYVQAGIRAVQSTPLISRAGIVLGTLSTCWNHSHTPSERELRLIDILARQAADLIERRQAEDALREADRRKDAFLVTLAHELRNPLAPVRSAVKLLKHAPFADPELARARDVIDRQTLLMARLLDDLLEVGRIARDRLELRLERAELGSIVRNAIEMSEPLLTQSQHVLHVSLPAEPLHVHVDSVRLGQIIGNLLNNAARYTEPAGHIWITVAREERGVSIAIRDTGVGLARDQLASIFDMFSQVDSSMERSRGGLGIGLYLVKKLAEMHDGRIEAASDGLGHGSTFTVRLPWADTTTDDSPATPPPDSPSVRTRSILVVDDNVDSAEMLAALLGMQQHQVHLAHDGPSALEAAAAFLPEVVLLDIGMPGMNGYDVCRGIREQPWGRDMVLIAVTGWGQESDRTRSRDAGFDHHVVKPLEHDALLHLLATLPYRRA